MLNSKRVSGIVTALVIVASLTNARSGEDRKMPRQAVHDKNNDQIELFENHSSTVSKDQIRQDWNMIENFWDSVDAPTNKALTYRFNGMNVNLLKKEQFDSWFTNEMIAAPKQIHLWKKHFDQWAEKRMSKPVVMQQRIDIDADKLKDAQAILDGLLSDQSVKLSEMQGELTQIYDEYIEKEGGNIEALSNDLTNNLFDMFNQAQQAISESVSIDIETETDTKMVGDGTVSLMQSQKYSSSNDNTIYKAFAAGAVMGMAVSAIAVTCYVSSTSKKDVAPNQVPLLEIL